MESKTGSLSSWRSRLYASGSALSVAIRPVRLPIRRPTCPRASSAMSGFFFCGMIDEPVESVVQGDEGELLRVPDDDLLGDPGEVHADHRGDEGELRHEVAGGRAVDGVRDGAVFEAEVPRHRLRSRLRPPPASAPEPYGETAVRSSHWRSCCVPGQGLDVSQHMVGEEHRLGVLEVRTAGIATSGCASARPINASWRSAIRPPIVRAWSRRHMRKSVATWSFRERPARSLPPRSGPRRSSSPRSRAVCTSSSAMVPTKEPSATSASSWSRPAQASASARRRPGGSPCAVRARATWRSGDVVRCEPPVEVDGRGAARPAPRRDRRRNGRPRAGRHRCCCSLALLLGRSGCAAASHP